MSAPLETTLGDLTGDWIMRTLTNADAPQNKTLSDDPDPVLALQGVSWFKRTIIAHATVTLHVRQYVTAEEGSDGDSALTHIDIDQTVTGGIKGTTELRTLDWAARGHSDDTFGDVKGRSRWLADLEAPGAGADGELDDFLKDGWLHEAAGPQGEAFVQSWVINEGAGWTAQQIWGFATVDGERYHTRRVVVKKGDEVVKVRLIYDWQGKK
ncbi:MAG: hypothetical protein M1818_001394 [Claussenomyces sp. TS43310]|nr:MAG: hypothetical protein M1818_001394 [Claussenomyces sp. TS43310]